MQARIDVLSLSLSLSLSVSRFADRLSTQAAEAGGISTDMEQPLLGQPSQGSTILMLLETCKSGTNQVSTRSRVYCHQALYNAGVTADTFRDKTPIRCLRSTSFWMLIAVNAIGSGAGLTLLNNLGEEVRPFLVQHCSSSCELTGGLRAQQPSSVALARADTSHRGEAARDTSSLCVHVLHRQLLWAADERVQLLQ